VNLQRDHVSFAPSSLCFADDDRRIDLAEFQAGLSYVGMSLSAAEAEAEFKSIDKNGGGIVLFDEFCLWYAEKRSTA
jgi:hypothetical protein